MSIQKIFILNQIDAYTIYLIDIKNNTTHEEVYFAYFQMDLKIICFLDSKT
jgi:hypothetical protein